MKKSELIRHSRACAHVIAVCIKNAPKGITIVMVAVEEDIACIGVDSDSQMPPDVIAFTGVKPHERDVLTHLDLLSIQNSVS